MISAQDIARCQAFEYVEIRGRAIMPSDPMVADPDHGYIGAPIFNRVKGSALAAKVREWDSQGRIVDQVREIFVFGKI